MTEMKKYTDIVRLGHRLTEGVLNEGDYVVAYEKLDGANASIKVENGEVKAFSRNRPLDSENTLRGFYGFAQTVDPSMLRKGFIYYGEWLVKHKVDYGVHADDFYLFDVYDEEVGEYLPHELVVVEAARLGLTLAPILYAGMYKGFEHLQSIVGRSALASVAGGGEGIVVKNVDYRDRFGKQTFVKLVSDNFREVQPQKAPKDPGAIGEEVVFVRSTVTKARVDKFIRKMVDEGLLDEKFGLEDMGVILKNLGGLLFDDLIKEESDSLPKDYNEKLIRKAIGKVAPVLVREIIEEETK